MSQVIDERQLTDVPVDTRRWMTVIYNNDQTPYQSVVLVLMAATGCDLQEASIETWEADTFGKACVHFALKDECLRAAEVISTIGVKTEVLPEWND